MADNPDVAVDMIDALVKTRAKVAADDIASVLYQIIKVAFGVDGVATPVSAADPLPVTGPLTDVQLRATSVPVTESNTSNLRASAASNTGSQVTVVATAGGTQVLAANASRKGYRIRYPAAVFTSYGGTPSATTFALPAGSVDEMTDGLIYTGAITSIAVTGTVVASVVEW